MCLGSWDLVFGEPVSYADFFHDIGPVVHRARDSNDNRFRRQPEKSVLTKPHQFRIGVIQPGRAARHPQGMFGRCDTEPASIVDRRVRHKSPYGHPSGGLRLTICHSFRRRGRRRQGSGCSRLMSPKVTLRLSGVHPSVDLGVVLTATHGADDGERPAGCHTVSRSGHPALTAEFPSMGSSAPPAAARTWLSRSPDSPARRADPARCARPAAVLARVGPGGRSSRAEAIIAADDVILDSEPCRPAPHTSTGSSTSRYRCSRPLRAARGGLWPAWTSPPRRDQRLG